MAFVCCALRVGFGISARKNEIKKIFKFKCLFKHINFLMYFFNLLSRERTAKNNDAKKFDRT